MWRLYCLVCLWGLASMGFASDPLAKTDAVEANGLLWYDALKIGVEGRHWAEVEAPYDRLPSKAKATVRDAVWNLSRHSAGMCLRFNTNASHIHARWSVTNANLAMPHMAATGVSGVDLYARDDAGVWRWVACGKPDKQTNTAHLAHDLAPAPGPMGREFRLYLPLYNGTQKLEIGVPKDADLLKADDYPEGHRQPIVFYGTSITHGACASRPGMPHPAILGRRFERPVVNLGFSGNGKLELALADLMAEIDASVYVLDCLPNMTAVDVKANTEPFIQRLREKKPQTPMLLVEDRTYSDAIFHKEKRQRNDDSRREFRAAYERLQAAGVTGLHYLEGERLLGDDNEGTVDSSHPTDLGFWRQADAMTPMLRPILKP
jgi:GDSL-like Lipase/Acylhydrolase family/N-terminus of Esterase_SGNH_hydro-type